MNVYLPCNDVAAQGEEVFQNATLYAMEEIIIKWYLPRLVNRMQANQLPLPRRTPDKFLLVLVAECFYNYFAAGGKISLDEAFGLRTRRGSTHPLRRRAERIRDFCYIEEMHQLIAIGLNRDEAAEAVSAKQQSIEDPSWLGKVILPRISAKTLVGRFHTSGGKKGGAARQAYKEAFRWSDAERCEFLRSFPKDALPLKFKKVVR